MKKVVVEISNQSTILNMKFFGLSLLALLIALASLVLEGHHHEMSFEESSSFQQDTSFEKLPLTAQSRRTNSQKHNYIAQTFVPFILVADFSYPIYDFTYYLNLYDHKRAKEYFLLI